jgi:hypothetical protein|tara:strand:- start:7216 stop:7734 length:519 start_codon:yes stop_codon:yes gene_type:complete
MVDVIKEYDLDGNYIFDRREGIQRGRFEYLSNHILLGSIQDDNSGSGNYGLEKLAIGLHETSTNSIYLAKISPDLNLAPILWILQNKEISNEGLSRLYSGYFQCSIPDYAPELIDLQNALSREEPNLKELRELIEPSTFYNVWFKEGIVDFIEHSGRQMEQLGTFGFTLSNP